MDSTGGDTRSETGNEETLRALAVRLAAAPFFGHGSGKDVQLLVGELPANLPFPVQLPDAVRVLGSLITPEQGTTIVLQTDLSPEDVLAFYREGLTAEGWTEPDGGERGSGFVPNMYEPQHRATFCRSTRGPALVVIAVSEDGETTDARLNIPSDHGPFRQMCRPQQRGTDPMREILPQLLAPPNARQQSRGGGGSPDSVQSSADLIGDLDLATLATHYNPQIERAGWTRQGAGQNGPMIWSTWTFEREGESWRGIFYVLQRPDLPDHFLLHIQAEWIADDEERLPRSGGWTSTTYRSP